MDNVYSLLQTTLNQPIQDVKSGIGTAKNVQNVQPTGFSTHKVFVFQYLINAELLMLQEPVYHAIKVMTQLKVNASSQLQTTLNQPIQDAKLGIGIIKYVSNVQADGHLIQKVFVFLFLIYVIKQMEKDNVLLVIKVMI